LKSIYFLMLEKLCYNGEILIQELEFVGDEMDTKISVNVKRLIELDQKSVALEQEWERQLVVMEESFKKEMESITESLQETKQEAKRLYNELLEKAQDEAKEMALEGERRIQDIAHNMENAVDGLAKELWGKIKAAIQ